MKKHGDLYYTTRKHLKGERNNTTPFYQYSWHMRNRSGEELESSLSGANILIHGIRPKWTPGKRLKNIIDKNVSYLPAKHRCNTLNKSLALHFIKYITHE